MASQILLSNSVEHFFLRCKEEVRILIALARCDGIFDQRECGWITEFVLDHNNFPNVSFDQVARHADTIYPDKVGFGKATKAVAEFDEKRKLKFSKFVRRVVDADGLFDNNEFDMVYNILEKIGLPSIPASAKK